MERPLAPKTTAKAIACYGPLRQDTQQVSLAFSQGQPRSAETLIFLPQLLTSARTEHKKVVVIWDNASWHKSTLVHTWITAHNRHAKQTGDVRLLTCLLPKQSPWLNPIEPRWVHAKRQVCELHGILSPDELKRRIATHFHTVPYAT